MRITIRRASLTHIDVHLATICGTALTVFAGSPHAPRARFPRWFLSLAAATFALGVLVSGSGQVLFFLAKALGIASLAFLVLLALTWTLTWCANSLQAWWRHRQAWRRPSSVARPASFRQARINKHRFLV